MKEKRIFVTVGTTEFSELIETVSKPDTLDILCNLGYTFIQFQTGNGSFNKAHHSSIDLQYDKYFEDFENQIEKADLVISHAGAGTCLEVLQHQKPLIVVINENLMNNHQSELAEQLQNDGYVFFCTCNMLNDTLLKDLRKLKLYPQPKETVFSNYLDKCMGFI